MTNSKTAITSTNEYVKRFGTEHMQAMPEDTEIIDFVDGSIVSPADCWTARIGIDRQGEFMLVGKGNVKALRVALKQQLNCTDEKLNFSTLKTALRRIQEGIDRKELRQQEANKFWDDADLSKPNWPGYVSLEEAAQASINPELLILRQLSNGNDPVSEAFVKKFNDGMTLLSQVRDEELGNKEDGDTFASRGDHFPWLNDVVVPAFLDKVERSQRPWSRYNVVLVSQGDDRKVIIARQSEFEAMRNALQRAWQDAKKHRDAGDKSATFRYTITNLPIAVMELRFQNRCFEKIAAQELKEAGGEQAINPLRAKLQQSPVIQALQAKMQDEAAAQVDTTRKGGRRKGKYANA